MNRKKEFEDYCSVLLKKITSKERESNWVNIRKPNKQTKIQSDYFLIKFIIHYFLLSKKKKKKKYFFFFYYFYYFYFFFHKRILIKSKKNKKENSSTSGSQVVTYPSTRLAWGGLTSRSGTRSGANRLVWPELSTYAYYLLLWGGRDVYWWWWWWWKYYFFSSFFSYFPSLCIEN